MIKSTQNILHQKNSDGHCRANNKLYCVLLLLLIGGGKWHDLFAVCDHYFYWLFISPFFFWFLVKYALVLNT